jgi:hypothetical protein
MRRLSGQRDRKCCPFHPRFHMNGTARLLRWFEGGPAWTERLPIRFGSVNPFEWHRNETIVRRRPGLSDWMLERDEQRPIAI